MSKLFRSSFDGDAWIPQKRFELFFSIPTPLWYNVNYDEEYEAVSFDTKQECDDFLIDEFDLDENELLN